LKKLKAKKRKRNRTGASERKRARRWVVWFRRWLSQRKRNANARAGLELSAKIRRIISAEVSEVLARRNSFLSEYAIFHFKRKNGGLFRGWYLYTFEGAFA